MHVKFRLRFDSKGERITQVFFVNDDGSMELITQMLGWIGMDFAIESQSVQNTKELTSETNSDNTKFIE